MMNGDQKPSPGAFDGFAYLALGSNLGDRLAHLREALAGLETRDIAVVARSAIYESAPMYLTDQPTFLNAAVKVAGERAPEELLVALHDLETELGRNRCGPRFGPRTVDLDILLLGEDGGIVVQSPHMTVPHPRMLERAFVLLPLAELAPQLMHPIRGLTISTLAARVVEAGDQQAHITDLSW